MPDSTKMLPLIVGAIEDKVEGVASKPEQTASQDPTPSAPEVVADGEVVALGGDDKTK